MSIADMNALPDISSNDSERLQEFVRVTTREVKAVGCASAGTTLEMIGYIRELEHALTNTRAAVTAPRGDWQPIATVPKDGDEVLLAHANSQWLDQWISDVTGDYTEGGYWMMCDQWTEPETPSHWKPLSPLPAAATSSPTPAESAPWSPNAAIELLEKWLQDPEVEHDEGLERLLRAINENSLSNRAPAERTQVAGEQDVKLRIESIAEPWICVEEKPCEEAVPVHWNEMITALVAAEQRSK